MSQDNGTSRESSSVDFFLSHHEQFIIFGLQIFLSHSRRILSMFYSMFSRQDDFRHLRLTISGQYG